MATKLTSSQRLDKAHVALLRNEKTLVMSGILMMGKSTITTTPSFNPTAQTDGLNKRYDDAFVQKLDDAELRAVVMHENLHVMFKHAGRRGNISWENLNKENKRKWGKAVDYVVNGFIHELDPSENFLKPARKEPAIWLYDAKFHNMDVGEVFRMLPDEECDGGEGGEGVPGHGGLDGHDFQEFDDLPQEKKEAIAREIDQAIRQGTILAGKVAGGHDRTFDKLLEPKVDWRKVLREFITTYCDGRDESTWRRPNRRWMQYDMVLPSMQGVATGDILVGIDTSGSIGGEMLTRFMSEVNAICTTVTPDKLHLLYWDCNVAAHEVYRKDQMGTVVAVTKPAGGGGTSPSCVTDYMREHNLKPKCAVMLTDGYVGNDWGGSWPCPVLWVIKGGCTDANPSTGVLVHAED